MPSSPGSPSTAPAPPRIDGRGLLLALALHLPVLGLLFADALRGAGRFLGATTTETWAFVWHHWCFRHELLGAGRFPYHLDLLDFPAGGTLWVKDPFWAIALLPVQAVGGVPAAVLTEQVSLFLLAGAGLFLLARELGVGRWPAALASLAFSFHPHMLGEAYNGNLEALAAGWMPLAAWGLLRALRRATWSSGVVAGLLVFLLALNNPYYGFALALALPLLVAAGLWAWWGERPAWARLAAVGGGGLLGSLLFLPIARLVSSSLASADNLALVDPQIPLRPPNTSDLVHLIRPMAELPLAEGTPPFQDLIYPGFLLLALALAAPALVAWAGRGRDSGRGPLLMAGSASLLALLFLVFSLGPVLCWQGQPVGMPDDLIFLPWAYLAQGGSLISRMTLPHRFAVPEGMFLAVGLAFALQALGSLLGRGRRRGRPWVARGAMATITALVLAEILLYPPYDLPLTTMELHPAPHAALLAEAEAPGAVLNLPIYRGGNDKRVYFWHQAVHGRPIDMAIRVGVPPTVAVELPLVAAIEATQHEDASYLWPEPPEGQPWSGAGLVGMGYGFAVLHAPFLTTEQLRSWVAGLDAFLGPGLVFDDGAVIYPLDPTQRPALEAQARGWDGYLGTSSEHLVDGHPFSTLRPGVPGRSRLGEGHP
jgi:hypothetical protein